MSSLKGKLLIAVPQLPDENFFRSVVVILKHSEEGALGLILNRPMSVTLDKVWKSISGNETKLAEPIYFGGPVEGPLMAIHCHVSDAEDSLLPGVFYSMRREQLDQLIEQQKLPFRIFTGHSGWGPGQLEHEIESGGWLLCDAAHDHVFDSADELWKNVCEEFGADILVGSKFRTHLPDDPSMN